MPPRFTFNVDLTSSVNAPEVIIISLPFLRSRVKIPPLLAEEYS
jgi:hypothetical protein